VHQVQGSRRAPLEVRRPLVWLVATAAITIGVDQLTKAIVRSSLQLDEAVSVIPGIFDIAHVSNAGAAFGMLPGRRPLFIAVSVLMLTAVALYWWRERPKTWPVVIPLGLVVGGAIGNLIDRLFVGRVTDLLAFSFFSPVFNLADSAIFVGVTALIIWVLFGPQPDEASVEELAVPAEEDPAQAPTFPSSAPPEGRAQ